MDPNAQETKKRRPHFSVIVATATVVAMSLLTTTLVWDGLGRKAKLAKTIDADESNDLIQERDELFEETQRLQEQIMELKARARACDCTEGTKSVPDANLPVMLRPTVDTSSWCPNAKCGKFPLCDSCQRRFLMVITNGRSASTTLTWMLDLLPDVRMAGENNNAVGNIMKMIKDTMKFPLNYNPSKRGNGPWDHNPIPEGSMACAAQSMIESINPPLMNANKTIVLSPQHSQNMIIGFKTIRLLGDDVTMNQVPEIAQFLKTHFPCTRYLINYRSDLKSQAVSQTHLFGMYKGESMDESLARLNAEIARLKEMARLLGDSAMVIDSSEWTKDVGALNKAVKWLGFDDSCAFHSILELNTAGKGYKNGKTKVRVHPNCRYVGR